MFKNPFKKKEDDYNIDDSSLKSMSDVQQGSLGGNMSGGGISNPSNNNAGAFSMGNDSMGGNTSQDGKIGNPFDNPFNNNDSTMGTSENLSPFEEAQINSGFPPGMKPADKLNFNAAAPGDAKSLSEEVIISKLESFGTRINSLEIKLSNMDQKLDYIYQMIASEVSEETLKKIKISNMVKTAKQHEY